MVVRLNSELFRGLKIPNRTWVTVVRVSLSVALIWITPELVKLLLLIGVVLVMKRDTFGGVRSTVIVMLTVLFTFPTVSLAKAVTVCIPSVMIVILTVAFQVDPLIVAVALNGVVLVLNINRTLLTPESVSVT